MENTKEDKDRQQAIAEFDKRLPIKNSPEDNPHVNDADAGQPEPTNCSACGRKFPPMAGVCAMGDTPPPSLCPNRQDVRPLKADGSLDIEGE